VASGLIVKLRAYKKHCRDKKKDKVTALFDRKRPKNAAAAARKQQPKSLYS
jgi:hypothetical protein